MTSDLHYVEELAEAPALFASIKRGFELAEREGAITARRDPPQGSQSCVWIGQAGGYPQGFCTFHRAGNGRMWLDVLYVFPSCRRQGVGRRLVEAVIRDAIADDCEVVQLGTAIGNEPMQALARSLGFKANVFGDCYRAAIASLLELPLDDVPHVFDRLERLGDSTEGDRIMDAFLAGLGLTRVCIPFSAPDLNQLLVCLGRFNPLLFYLLAGAGPRGTNHIVVCHGPEIVHDPSIDGGGLTGPGDDGFYWFHAIGRGPMQGFGEASAGGRA